MKFLKPVALLNTPDHPASVRHTGLIGEGVDGRPTNTGEGVMLSFATAKEPDRRANIRMTVEEAEVLVAELQREIELARRWSHDMDED